MAKLTDTLDTVNSGKPIIEPPGTSNVSFLGGLSKLASGLTTGAIQNQAQADKLTSRNIQNQIEKKVTGLEAGVANDIRFTEGLEAGLAKIVPPDVAGGVQRLEKDRRAVDQGRQSQDAMDLKLEKFLTEMHAKYPDQVAEINQYMSARKFDHYLFREQKDRESLSEAGKQGERDGYNAMVQLAVQNGYGDMGLNEAQLYKRGVQAHQAQIIAENEARAKEAERQAHKDNRDDVDWWRKEHDRQALASVQAQTGADIGGLTDMLLNATEKASTNDEAFKRLMELRPNVATVMQQYRMHTKQRLARAGASPEALKAVDEELDQQEKSINDIWFGDKSRFQARVHSLQAVQTELGLNEAQGLKFYSYAKRIWGNNLAEAMPEFLKSMSPDLKSKITQELLTYDPMKPNQGLDTLAQIGLMMKGNVKLQDLPEGAMTGDHIVALNTAVMNGARNIMDPAPDEPEEYQTFLNSAGTLASQSLSIQPGYKDVRGLDYALGVVVNPAVNSTLASIIKQKGDFEHAAVAVFDANRQSAAHLLQVADSAATGLASAGQKIVLKNGKFVVEVPPDQKDKSGGNLFIEGGGGFNYSPVGGIVTANAPNPQLKQLAEIKNKAVSYLVDTALASSEYKGYTRSELFNWYARGIPLKPKTEGGKAPTTDADTAVTQVETELQRLSNDVQTKTPFLSPDRAKLEPIAHEAADQFGVPRQGASWLFGQESGWRADVGTQIDNNGDGKPDSSAVGIAQFIKETGRRYGLVGDGFDNRTDPTKAIPAAMNYLADLKKKTGDWIKALHAYGVLARSNFKTDADYNRTVAAARAAFGD